jgi:hypothetical protein
MDGSELQDLEQSQQLRLLSDEDIPESHPSQSSDNSVEHTNNNEHPGPLPAAQDSSGHAPDNTGSSEWAGESDNDSALVEQTIQTRRPKRHEFREWNKELLCSFFSIAFLGAMVGTIYPFHGQPRPQWPFSISINALLSIYAIIFKAALISVVTSSISQSQWNWFAVERPLHDFVRYDKAGRDTLEALRWLWWNKLRQPLTNLGAVICVVAVAIDPFIQQLVQYVDCSVTLAQDVKFAAIPRTSFFNPTMFHQGALNDDAPSSAEESAVISGIFSPPTDIEFNCLTGNCTFPFEYGTVGYCSYCEDLSSNLKFLGDCNQETCNITSTLPSGLSLSSEVNSSGKIGFLTMSGNGLVGSYGDAGPFEVIVGRTGYTQKRLDPTTNAPIPGCDDPATNNTWRCRGYGAASCSFNPCVRTYKASVTAGRLNESMVDHSDPRLYWGFPKDLTKNHRGRSFIRGIIDTRCISSEENNKLTSLGYVVDPQSRWLPYNLTFDGDFNVSQTVPPDAPFPQSLLAHKCLYMISQSFTLGFFQYFLSSLLDGTVTGQATGTVAVGFDGPQVPLHIYNFSHNDFDTIDGIFSNAASVLTMHIRENGEEIYSKPALGVVSHFAICVQINWAWISLPAALAGLTLVLLGFSIEATRKQQAPIWKSSPLAFIFHGPGGARWYDNSGSIQESSLNTVSAMESSAKCLTVVMDRSEPVICLRKIGVVGGNQVLPKTWFERIFKRRL